MALTVHDKKPDERLGTSTMVQFQVDADASYPALGYPLDLSQAQFGGLRQVDFVEFGVDGAVTTWLPYYDYTRKTLRLYTALGTELGTGVTAVTLVNLRVRATGNG